MATTNRERVNQALELLREGLAPFVEREFNSFYGEKDAPARARSFFRDTRLSTDGPLADWDIAALLSLMVFSWPDVFRQTLGQTERSIVSELRDWRNKWAHQEQFSSDDAERCLDSAARLLTAISAPQAQDVAEMRKELRRLVYDEQVRGERRRAGASLIEGVATGNLTPWRDIITPHADVASGRYQQAEFAADLWQVHLGEGPDEYRKPSEFFRRTFLTESLTNLLVNGVRRVVSGSGDPVIQLQTNFGGGKTHSMLALYHLFGGTSPDDLLGVDTVLKQAGATALPAVNRVVLVGNKISPGNPTTKPDGTVVRTLWGELAYQLGGKRAFDRIAADDAQSTSPGDALRELMNEYGPCLILVDEWVAYARQLHDQADLPGGSFETQFTFAQTLTESAKAAKNCLLVVSLPASDTAGSPHTLADDVEVGGERGRQALDRLRNVVGRLESSWRPATAEEGFEIVRRRLFEPITDPERFKRRDVTSRAFFDLYQREKSHFPPETQLSDYEKRIQAAFPIHPEIFDRLYTDWSTLVKFQRTRGVLRLMAAVIHSLWEKGDQNPLILPATLPIDDQRVQSELTRYLSDNWSPIIERDVDGPNSLPLKIDSDVTNLGKLGATRRVARTIYLGSAPGAGSAHQGLEDRLVNLGCVMPGESPAIFGDALRRLASSATFLYQDGNRYWYSTQPTVTKLAEDRAEQFTRNPDKVAEELERRLKIDLQKRGEFRRIHPLPRNPVDVPDDTDARLVVLGSDQAYSKDADNPAVAAAKTILDSRGSAPRLHRNTLVFLAPDKVRLQDLDDALRRYLAWRSIVEEKEPLNLDPHQARQAETQLASADSAVTARLPEAYLWLLVPKQKRGPSEPVEWDAVRLSGSGALAERACKKLISDELLVTRLGGSIVRKYLDEVPLWRGDHVTIRQLVDDFAQQLYLPRLTNPDVLAAAIQEGVAQLTWHLDGFAYADAFDERAGRYQGLRVAVQVMISPHDVGVVVKPDIAGVQIDAERSERERSPGGGGNGHAGGDDNPDGGGEREHEQGETDTRPRRYYGSVHLDPARAGRDAGQIADEILAHLVSILGADVQVTLEIEARLPDGASEQLVRTVTENSRTLKFDAFGFETD